MYEYRCGQCHQVFEVIQRFSDDPLTTHEGCGGVVERLISAPAFQFKGSGFYITDYARGSGTGAPAAPPKEGGAKDSGGSTKESKPASSTSSSSSSSESSSSSASSSSDSKK
ncbi:MAG TPA: FmdB family zinc ribbon protein [Bryobacteraceae bacterium]|nr:FmdB family zinc ribbon protein [Bryobacteraceae bacterium]